MRLKKLIFILLYCVLQLIFNPQLVFGFEITSNCKGQQCDDFKKYLNDFGCFVTVKEKTNELQSSRCYLLKKNETSCRDFFAQSSYSLDSQNKIEICKAPAMVLSCDPRQEDDCIKNRANFYTAQKCQLDEQTTMGYETREQPGKARRTSLYNSDNCISVHEKESCPSGYEKRKGYSPKSRYASSEQPKDEQFCLKTKTANEKPSSTRPAGAAK